MESTAVSNNFQGDEVQSILKFTHFLTHVSLMLLQQLQPLRLIACPSANQLCIVSDLRQGHPRHAQSPAHADPLYIFLCEQPSPRSASYRGWKEFLSFIEPQSVDTEPSPATDLTDRQKRLSHHAASLRITTHTVRGEGSLLRHLGRVAGVSCRGRVRR